MTYQFDPILGTGRDGAVSLAEQQKGFDAGTPAQQAAFQASVSGGLPEDLAGVVEDLSNLTKPLRSLNRVYASNFGQSTLTAVVFGDSMGSTKWATIGPQLNRAMGATRAAAAAIPATTAAPLVAGNDMNPYTLGGEAWGKLDSRYDLWPTGQVPRLDAGDAVRWQAGGGNPQWTSALLAFFKELGAGSVQIYVSGTLVQTVSDLDAASGISTVTLTQSYGQTEIKMVAVGGPVRVAAVNAVDKGTSGVRQAFVARGGLPLNIALFKQTARDNMRAYIAALNPDLVTFEMKEDTNYASMTPLVITGGGGSGAECYAQISAAGAINGSVIINCGSGFTSTPTITVSAATGAGAVITASVANGAITALNVSSSGAGYTTVGASPGGTFTDALSKFTGILDAAAPVADKHFFAGLPVATPSDDASEIANAAVVREYCNANKAKGYGYIDTYSIAVSYANVTRLSLEKSSPLTNSGAVDGTHLSPDIHAIIAGLWLSASGLLATHYAWIPKPINAPHMPSRMGVTSRVYSASYSDLFLEFGMADGVGYSWDMLVARDFGASRQNGQRLMYIHRDGLSLTHAALQTKTSLLTNFPASSYPQYTAIVVDLNGAGSPGMVYSVSGSWRRFSDNSVVS